MPYFPNVLLLHLMPLNHRFSLEETAVFVIVESLLAEKMGLLFSLRVLQVLLMFGYSFLLLFLRRAVVLVHFLQAYRVKTRLPLASQCHRTRRTFNYWLLLCHPVHERTPKSRLHHRVPAEPDPAPGRAQPCCL